MATPLMLVGDGPQEATGLGRLARDLGGLVAQSGFAVDLVSVGGAVPPCWTAWPHVPMGPHERGEDWGASFVEAVWQDRFGGEPGVVWAIGWDPARMYAYRELAIPVQLWLYPAVDACNVWGGLSGPPAAALQKADRVIAYGRWASEIIKTVRDGAVPYLPHGLHLGDFSQPATTEEQAWVRAQLGPHVGAEAKVVGCVATNQARKDLALFCETLRILRDRGHHVHGWLHTDQTVGAWSIEQLVVDNNLAHRLTVTLGTLTDRQLACLYQRSAITIAPGLGEGFGYPIVESLAAGTPVVHGDYGGGSELVPKIEWRVPMWAQRRESVYALTRPIFKAEDVANAIERAWRWRTLVGQDIATAYCQGAVAHLDWGQLGPRWAAWIREGLS